MHECIPYEHPFKQQFTTLRMKTDRRVSSSKTHLLSILSYPTAQIIPGVSLGYAPTPNPAPQPSKNKKRPQHVGTHWGIQAEKNGFYGQL